MTNTYKDYKVPTKLQARYGKLVAQIGGGA
jgi:hypothetical protein